MESITFKEFLSKNKIINFTIHRNSNTITRENNEGSVNVLNIGRKYQAVEINELIEDGFIILNGFQGQNWIWVLNKKYGFNVVEIDQTLLEGIPDVE